MSDVELTAQDWVMIGNAVRQMTGMCIANEKDIQKDLAYELVYGNKAKADDHKAMLEIAEQATAEHVALMARLDDRPCSQCQPGHDRGDGKCERHGKRIPA